MLYIKQNGNIVATVDKVGNGNGYWLFQYQPSASQEINPAMPLSTLPITFKNIPPFLMGLLPQGARVERILGKSENGLREKDYIACLARALSLENIGDLTVTYGASDNNYSVNIPSGTNVFDDLTLEKLENPEHRQFLSERMKERFFAAGVTGTLPKMFYRTREGEFIIKEYQNPKVAQSEAASLKAYANVGGRIAETRAYGNFIVSKRLSRLFACAL